VAISSLCHRQTREQHRGRNPSQKAESKNAGDSKRTSEAREVENEQSSKNRSKPDALCLKAVVESGTYPVPETNTKEKRQGIGHKQTIVSGILQPALFSDDPDSLPGRKTQVPPRLCAMRTTYGNSHRGREVVIVHWPQSALWETGRSGNA
jgi:hypothetical protein